MPTKERRKSTDHDVVLTVVQFLGWIGIILGSSLAVTLIGTAIYSIITGKELQPSTVVITAVAGAFGSVCGYIGGILSNAFRGTAQPTGTPSDPITTESKITNAPSEAVPTTDTPTPEPAPPTQTDEGETITEESD